LVTGASSGLGRAAAEALLERGHDVVMHLRSKRQLPDVDNFVQQGASTVVGDLSDLGETRSVADQVNALGRMNAVIHNAGTMTDSLVLPVNVVAPYLLTALIDRPDRLVYLSSSMHRGGRRDLDGLDWSGSRVSASYSDSKLLVTTLGAAVARIWQDVFSHAVDPGWVPTRMGGPGAPDDLRLGSVTQAWLAVSDEPQVRTTGGYWHHQRRLKPDAAVHDQDFQDRLLDALARHTGTPLQ
jgi:NAD(P)-dependent dehydrogenase (short-subunit alcohol dehydrogenase family)